MFDVEEPGVDETRLPEEAAHAYVERIAREKVAAVAGPGVLALGADTAVVHEGHVLGKPAHPEEARSMLRRLQGEVHEVVSGVAMASEGVVESLVDVATVRMMAMTIEEIVEYVDTGEPMDKAGGYALQGRGGAYVESVSGSPFTVIGLPIHLLSRLARRVGVDLTRFDARTGH